MYVVCRPFRDSVYYLSYTVIEKIIATCLHIDSIIHCTTYDYSDRADMPVDLGHHSAARLQHLRASLCMSSFGRLTPAVNMATVTFNNGLKMPLMGFGTLMESLEVTSDIM